MFADRRDAGRRLAARLQHLQKPDVSVLGIPRGGVIVAAEVAAALDAPLDVIVPRKIGAPFNPELAVGAVAPDGTIFYDEALIDYAGIDRRDLERQAAKELQEIRRRLSIYRDARRWPKPSEYRERTVILVDDGIATGYTVQAALRSLRRQKPSRLVLAVPVAPPGFPRPAQAGCRRGHLPADPRRFLCRGPVLPGFPPDHRRGGHRRPGA